MNLYRIEYDIDLGVRYMWCGTRAAAKKAELALEAQLGRSAVGAFQSVEVPTSKAALLEFLNVNARVGGTT